MKIKQAKQVATAALFCSTVVAAIFLPLTVSGKEPPTPVEKVQQNQELMKSVNKGYQLWHSPSLGTNGLACGNCHPDASATNPHTWPKYQTNLSKVSTMPEMFNWCIAVPLMGKTLSYDSDEMVALISYATYMHRGVAFAPGKDEQYGGVPVTSGPGFPTGNDGNR